MEHLYLRHSKPLEKQRHHSPELGGLALGLTSFLFVTLYMIDETRYDRYNARHDRIFRVDTALKFNDAITSFAVAAPPVAEALVDNFPEVEKAARLMPLRIVRFSKEDEIIREDRVFYADSSLFNIFTLTAVHGDPASTLASPAGIVITESTAKRYFNSTDVIGREIAQADDTTQLVVGVVIRDICCRSLMRSLVKELRSPVKTFVGSSRCWWV